MTFSDPYMAGLSALHIACNVIKAKPFLQLRHNVVVSVLGVNVHGTGSQWVVIVHGTGSQPLECRISGLSPTHCAAKKHSGTLTHLRYLASKTVLNLHYFINTVETIKVWSYHFIDS
jgi:hypothetical protein